jgi:hypothetical protein
MPVRDYRNYKDDHTLIFNVQDLAGNFVKMVVPPLDPDTEKAMRKFQLDNTNFIAKLQETLNVEDPDLTDEEREAKQKTINESKDRTVGEYWAPFVSVAVKDPEGLTPEYLIANFWGPLLRDMGGDIMHFFTFNELPEIPTPSA